MRLWYGPFPTSLYLIGAFDDVLQKALQEHKHDEARRRRYQRSREAQFTHLWNRYTSSWLGNGVKPLFRVTFDKDLAKQTAFEQPWNARLEPAHLPHKIRDLRALNLKGRISPASRQCI